MSLEVNICPVTEFLIGHEVIMRLIIVHAYLFKVSSPRIENKMVTGRT
jgi:hypothetical protein